MKAECRSRYCDPRAGAVALGRWCLGIIFLFYGLGKFMGGVNVFAEGMVKQFEKTMLPPGLVTAFSYALPVLEVSLGVLLILGLARDVVLFVTGLLLIALTFGQVMLQQPQVVFFNTAYTMIAAVLLFASKYDRWVLLPGCCRWRGDEKESGTEVERK
jgi:thiosulfate dehydrogenase (quinone) large subunit